MEERFNNFDVRQTEFANRQTAFSQRQNIFDLRLNTQDNKILFLSQQIESIKNDMSKFGQQAARSINPNEIIPEPYPGEEEFLKGIVAGKLPELEMIFLTNSSIYLKSLK